MPKKKKSDTVDKIDQILKLASEVEKDLKELLGALDPEWRRQNSFQIERTMNGVKLDAEILRDMVEALQEGNLSALEP